MSVPKNKRSLSDLEVFHSAYVLRKEVTALLLRDFGIKPRKRNIEIISRTYEIENEDFAELKRILKSCGVRYEDEICIYEILDKVQATEKDKESVRRIVKKYRMSEEVLSEFPKWLIDDCRENLLNFSKNVVHHLFKANSIYPTSTQEFYERRLNQDRAIGYCECIYQELQYIVDTFPVDAQQYIRYSDMIDKEVSLIKGWRKSDNRILRQIKQKEKQDK